MSRLDSEGVLTITGDDADNTVRVAVVGDDIVVVADGKTKVLRNAADDLTAINADLGDGDDVLRVNLGSSLGKGDSLDITADTGDGDDTVVVRADALGRDATLTADIDTGDGNDRDVFALGELGRGATVDATVDLGEGDDVFRWNGGGLGRDASVTLEWTPARATTGSPRSGRLGRDATFAATLIWARATTCCGWRRADSARATATIDADLGDGGTPSTAILERRRGRHHHRLTRADVGTSRQTVPADGQWTVGGRCLSPSDHGGSARA